MGVSETLQQWDSQVDSYELKQRRWRDKQMFVCRDWNIQNNRKPEMSKRVAKILKSENVLSNKNVCKIMWNTPILEQRISHRGCTKYFFPLPKTSSSWDLPSHTMSVLLSLFSWRCSCLCSAVTGKETWI